MKKIRSFHQWNFHYLMKIFRIMRITVFLLLVSILQTFANDSYSQKTRLSLNFSNTKLADAMDEIEEQSEFYFLFNEKLIDTDRKVSISVKNRKIDKILDDLFAGTDVNYTITDRKIILAPSFLSESVQQQKAVSGTVTDETGQPLIGVTVIVKGTTTGTVTNVDGKYSIPNIPENATLLFSFVGMQTQEIIIGNQTSINVTMQVDAIGLEEVVAVGYATQKRVTLTGSVDIVKGEDLQSRPAANISQLIQGTTPSLNITVSNLGGEPGANPTWNIRGLGTLSGNSSPLILVDGVAMNINNVDPNTIESISILKDAAASAIYGSRAPFGVVLITTKQGGKNSKFSLSYNSNFGFASPIGVPHMESSVNLATAFNEVNANSGVGPKFPEDQIKRMQEYIDGKRDAEYDLDNPFSSMWRGRHDGNANYDWNQMYWKKNSFRQKHDISMSGGNNKTQYYISSEYYGQDGLFNYGTDKSNRYSVLANITSQINEWIKINYSSRFAQTSYDRPVGPFGSDNMRFFMLQAMQTFWPTMPMYNDGVDKSDRIHSINNPLVRLLEGDGRNATTNNDSWITLGTEIEPIKGWKTKISYNYNYFNSRNETTLLPIPVYLPAGNVNNIGSSNPKYSTYSTSGDYKLFNAITSYNKNIGDHYVNVLLGYESESRFDASLSGSVTNLITPYVPAINTGTGSTTLGESKGHWGTEAVFGRFQYNYKEKYLFEINGRYNGSSRFAPDHRWGFFPSVSAGYNISKEDFWADISNTINSLKIRASYGSLGNQNVPNYLYLSTVPTGVNLNYVIGNERPMWASIPDIVSGSLTWETVTTLDIGVDMSFLKNRLNANFDWYNRVTDNMFGPAETVPSILGTAPPQKNNAKMETKGWETTISWRDRIGSDISYNLKLMVGDAKSKVLEYNNDNGFIDGFYNGKQLGEIWGYTTDGIIQKEGETMPDQSVFYDSWGPGDIKYKDLDGDNKITYGERTLDSHGDLSVIGNTTPRYSIGFSGGMSWKGFDVNMFWQGIGKHQFFPEYTWSSSTFWGFAGGTNNSTVFKEGHLDYWRPANETNLLGPNTDAYYPKPYFTGENEKSRQIQTRYLLNAAYLRLKNLQVGYTIPTEISQKIYIQKLRLYFSAENLLTITKLTKLLDPETSVATAGYLGHRGIGRVYPLSRIVSFGLNLTF